jgi:hypothetical protein
VDHLPAVGVVQRRRQLVRQQRRSARVERRTVLQPPLQRRAVHQLHVEVVAAVGLAGLVQGDDVRVPQPGQVLGVAAEAGRARVVVRRAAAHHLERHVAVVLRVVGAVDHCRRTAAQLALDLVAADRAGRGGVGRVWVLAELVEQGGGAEAGGEVVGQVGVRARHRVGVGPVAGLHPLGERLDQTPDRLLAVGGRGVEPVRPGRVAPRGHRQSPSSAPSCFNRPW